MVEMSYRMGTMDLYSPPFMKSQTIFLCDVRNKQYNEFKRVILKHLPDLESCQDLFTFVKRSCSLNPQVSSSDDVVAYKTKSNEFEPYVFEKVSFDEFLDRYMFSKIFVVLKRKDDTSFMQYFVQNDAKNAGNKLGFAKIQESNTANDIVNFCNHKQNSLDNEMTLHQNNTLFVMNNFCPLQPQVFVERYQIPELSTLYILPKILMQASGTIIREKDNSHYSVSCTSANSFGQLVEMFVEKINKCEGTCLTRKEIRLTYIINGSTFIIKSDQAVAAAIWQQGHDLPDTIHLWIHIINPESFSMKVRLKSRQKMPHRAFYRRFHNSEEIPDAVIVFCNRGTTIKDVKHNICVQTKIDEDSVKIFNNSNQSVLPDSYCIGEIETPRPTLTCVQQKPSRIKVEVTIDDCANNIIEDTVEAYDHSTCQRLREIIVSRLHLQDELKLDLFFGGTGKCFDRENTLSDAGTIGPPLVRATYYRRRIIIFAKLRDQHLSRITINNPAKFTVGQLKRSIAQKHAFSTNIAINVIWNGQCLFEGQTIDSCGISHRNIIVVTCGSRKMPPPPFLTVFVARFDDCSKDVEEWFAVKEEVTQSLKFLSRLTEESTTAIMDAFTSIMKDHTLDNASAATVETTRQLSFSAFNDAEQSSHSSPADSPSRQLTHQDYDDSPCATENSDPTQEWSKSVTSSLNINADVFVPRNTKQNTSLSADAPEFIPKPLSADAQEFVPRKNIAAGDGEASDTSNLCGFEEDCVFIVEQVQYTLTQLSSSPSSLDYLALSLRETLAAYQTNDSVLLSVIDLIVQQAISDRNLCYSAARLCSHLCTSLVALCDSGLGTFRSHLMNRCRDEFNKASVNLKSPETVSKVYGFTQFMGEIYLSLLIKKADGSSARVTILQTKILELLVLLSTLPTTDGNIKCVVQTLKFCGSAIEDDLRIAGDSTGLDNLFELLRLVMLEKFSRLTKEIIANLVDLRNNNWGRNTSTLSPTTSEHFQFRTPSPFSQGFEEDCVFIVEQVQYTLSQLSSSPSSLDYLASSLRETLADYQTNDTVLLSVIDLIVQQAISDRNLCYSAARLCCHLCTSLVALCDSGLGTFRSHLMNRCRDEFNKASVNLKSPETVSQVYGFTQFMGEIYLSLLIKKADGSSARVTILQTKILELLVLLSTLPTTDGNIKCVVQTLKFCGSAIEDDLRIAGDSTGLDNLFELLRLVMLEKFSRLTKEIIANLVDLRSNNWGRNTSTPSPTTSEHFEFRTPSPFSQTEPVFYNDKGQVITREEAGFASNDDSQLYIPDESSADNDYGVWNEASLDVYEDADEDEIAEAFEQFMIESEQSGT